MHTFPDHDFVHSGTGTGTQSCIVYVVRARAPALASHGNLTRLATGRDKPNTYAPHLGFASSTPVVACRDVGAARQGRLQPAAIPLKEPKAHAMACPCVARFCLHVCCHNGALTSKR